MVTRKSSVTAAVVVMLVSIASFKPLFATDMPPALANAKAQFYNFLVTVATGTTPQQNLVLNSTIMPFDIATDTPFFNDELFREYADRTFTGGIEGLRADGAAFLSARFSSQYRAVLNIATAKIDQNHPEIANSIADLRARQTNATKALEDKIAQFDSQWTSLATARGLLNSQGQPLNPTDYNLQYATWLSQVRYADQLQTYIDAVDQTDAQLDAARRAAYSTSEIAALDNYGNLSAAYNVARPWTANLERSLRASGSPLTELQLANPRELPPALFDSAPLILPVGDLSAFLGAAGTRGYDSTSQSYQMNSSSSSWTASGGGSFLGWSIGGGASGSSSMTQSISRMTSISISFKNLSEYLADRSAWFNPGVLQDQNIIKLVQGRPELNHLQYVAVSLLIARGTTLVLKFSDSVNRSDWSQSSFSAQGGASFLGFSFGGSGGSSASNYSVSVSSDGTTVTIQDGDLVARVLGARVEDFLHSAALSPNLAQVLFKAPGFKNDSDAVKQGKTSYLEFQKARYASNHSGK